MDHLANTDKVAANRLSAFDFNQAKEITNYQLQRLGWQGAIGLILIVISLLYMFLIVNPKAAELKQMQLDANNFKTISKTYADDHKIAQFDVVKDFYRLLPAQNEANDKISVILNAATNAGLSLEKIEYNQPLTQSPITHYQIKLPIKGSYIQVRQFLNEVLNSVPTIALNEVSMRRDDLSVDTLETRIQFTLYLKT